LNLECDAIVLAGGLGTRLRAVVPDRPKPMALVGGRPFLDYVLGHLAAHGLKHVVLSIGYMGEVIREHYGSAHEGMALSYAVETEPLGTGGALQLAMGQCRSDWAIAVNGDTLLDADPMALLAATRASGSPLGVVVREVPDTLRYGRCEVQDGRLVAFGEKGVAGQGYINGGMYAISRGLFQRQPLPERFSFETEILTAQLQAIRPCAMVSDAYFIDMGIPEDYARAQVELPARQGQKP
jgi:D-glycero-alpha-D-manno-heptose 1-phosphate guanylyltransferase